jgi:hypothetical protein
MWKDNFVPYIAWSHWGGVGVWLHSFSTSTLDRTEDLYIISVSVNSQAAKCVNIQQILTQKFYISYEAVRMLIGGDQNALKRDQHQHINPKM